MDLLHAIFNAGGGNAASHLARQFGLDQNQVQAAVANLLPALAGGLRQNAATPEGFQSLLEALAGGQHQRYVDDLSSLESEDTRIDGNAILGHILGSKDVSRQVAGRAAEMTGIGSDVLKRMLPVVAAMAMGALSKQSAGAAPSQAPGLLGMLTPMLDSNQDGSILDDVLGMAKKLF